MSVKGIVLDENNEPIRQNCQIYCQVQLENGDVEYAFVDEEIVQHSEAVADPVADANLQKEVHDETLLRTVAAPTEKEFHWTTPMVKLLIETYKTLQAEGKMKYQKHFWAKVAIVIAEKGYPVSGAQCDNKWKGMLKIYKKYKDRVNTTGEAGGFIGEHYAAMDEVMFKKPAISPVALSSNLKGYRVEVAKQDNKKMRHLEDVENVPENGDTTENALEDGQGQPKKKQKKW